MATLNSSVFVAVTGNGLGVTEDLARRFLASNLDARVEDPESRPFKPGFLDQLKQSRAALLEAALTIWRWGRQNAADLKRGRAFGSFETWCEWVRDPLLTLGCKDPVERIDVVKAQDPHRQRAGEIFQTWWKHHDRISVTAQTLADPVRYIIDPQNRGRQYVAAALSRLASTRAAGYVLVRQDSGRWNPDTYALRPTGVNGAGQAQPMNPMGPMPDAVAPESNGAPPDDDVGPETGLSRSGDKHSPHRTSPPSIENTRFFENDEVPPNAREHRGHGRGGGGHRRDEPASGGNGRVRGRL